MFGKVKKQVALRPIIGGMDRRDPAARSHLRKG
jgi:hypothetical protein